MSTSEDVYFKDCDKIRIINIPTLSINSTDFNISPSEKESLYKSGYDSAKTFLSNWSFQDYLEKYFGFRKAYCKLHIQYNPKLKWVIRLLYPIRRLLMKMDGIGVLHSLNAVLRMEEICRSEEQV